MKINYYKLRLLGICFSLFIGGNAFAQKKVVDDVNIIDSVDVSVSEAALEKAIQNPVASMVSMPFQNNLDFNETNTNTLNVQPVLPFKMGGISLILRTIMPVISAPDATGVYKRNKGIGNISSAFLFTPTKSGKLVWALGPTFTWSTLTHGIGSEKTLLAPSGLLLYQNKGWTIGTLIQNSWSIAGPSNAPDVNLGYAQVFIVKNLKKGWYVNTAPIMTANWNAPGDSRWTIPLGAGFGKLSRINKLPINWQVGYYGFVEHPTGASSQLRMQVVFILPKLY